VAACGGSRGRIYGALRHLLAGAEATRGALRQRTFLTHVEAGYFYKMNRPDGTNCGRVPSSRVLVDFGQVSERDGYSSLHWLKDLARN